jgi:hypothetical protein
MATHVFAGDELAATFHERDERATAIFYGEAGTRLHALLERAAAPRGRANRRAWSEQLAAAALVASGFRVVANGQATHGGARG